PADRELGKPRALLDEAFREGRVEDIGWRVRKDGSQFWASALITRLDSHGQHIGFAKGTRDLTDRTYRRVVEAAHAIVWTTDPSGQPNADSPSWRALTGQTEAEWRGPKRWDPIHPDDRQRIWTAWTASRDQGVRLDIEYRIRRSDGVYVWMAVSA